MILLADVPKWDTKKMPFPSDTRLLKSAISEIKNELRMSEDLVAMRGRMFRTNSKAFAMARIDLESVRETLLYIESDFRHAPGYETVAAAISAVLGEIDRVELEAGPDKRPQLTLSHFVPVAF